MGVAIHDSGEYTYGGEYGTPAASVDVGVLTVAVCGFCKAVSIVFTLSLVVSVSMRLYLFSAHTPAMCNGMLLLG